MLKYIGRGAFLAGIPKRDLSADEVKKFGKARLLKSKLYKENKKKPVRKRAEE